MQLSGVLAFVYVMEVCGFIVIVGCISILRGAPVAPQTHTARDLPSTSSAKTQYLSASSLLSSSSSSSSLSPLKKSQSERRAVARARKGDSVFMRYYGSCHWLEASVLSVSVSGLLDLQLTDGTIERQWEPHMVINVASYLALPAPLVLRAYRSMSASFSSAVVAKPSPLSQSLQLPHSPQLPRSSQLSPSLQSSLRLSSPSSSSLSPSYLPTDLSTDRSSSHLPNHTPASLLKNTNTSFRRATRSDEYESGMYQRGDYVEVQQWSRDYAWVRCRVCKDWGDGTYNVRFQETGRSTEEKVTGRLMRPWFRKGDRVEARRNNSQRWRHAEVIERVVAPKTTTAMTTSMRTPVVTTPKVAAPTVAAPPATDALPVASSKRNFDEGIYRLRFEGTKSMRPIQTDESDGMQQDVEQEEEEEVTEVIEEVACRRIMTVGRAFVRERAAFISRELIPARLRDLLQRDKKESSSRRRHCLRFPRLPQCLPQWCCTFINPTSSYANSSSTSNGWFRCLSFIYHKNTSDDDDPAIDYEDADIEAGDGIYGLASQSSRLPVKGVSSAKTAFEVVSEILFNI